MSENVIIEQITFLKEKNKSGNTFSEICKFLDCDSTVAGWPDSFGSSLKRMLDKSYSEIKTLSLFSGAGGLDVGFHDAGFEIVESVEIEKKFCDTLIHNSGEGKYFSESKVNCVDIREYSSSHLPKIDFIIGGPPCQTFSAAGRRANGVLGTTDARGVLFREYVRLLQELSPVGFLFENVYGIVGAQNGDAWAEIQRDFSNAGYKLFYRILDAADYGVPQHRERLFIVGLKENEFRFPRPTHGPDSIDANPFYSAKLAVEGIDLSDETYNYCNGRYGHLLDDIPPGLNYSFYTEEMGHPQPIFAWRSKFSDFLYKADPETPVRTIKAQGGQYTGPFHWENRFFTVSEYKRLQTFPESYPIIGSKQVQIHQIGNSVPPQIARMLAMTIRNQVFNSGYQFEIPVLEDYEVLGFRKRKRQLTEKYKKKAEVALSNIDCSPKNEVPKSHSYTVTMNEGFDYNTKNCEVGDFKISVEWANKLEILVVPNGEKKAKSPHFSIRILPVGKRWNVGAEEIMVDCYDSTIKSYTVSWKAIERELIRNNIKADLVQLCGYYQYSPSIRCELIIEDSLRPIGIFEKVVNGIVVGKMLSSIELASLLGISEDEVFQFASLLRAAGYEIRNHNTNPQISENQWLIPYAFPTLTPLSVQLRKQLEATA